MIDGTAIILIVIAYLLGNISPSILLGKMYGIDIKSHGSGNAGTTNALRVLGKKAGIITLIVDIGKGMIAVFLGRYFGNETIAMACGVMAFAGHIWPVFFKFKGGKGVATAFGVIFAINQVLGLAVALIMVLVVLITRRVSAGSVISALIFPFVANAYNPEYLWWTLIMAVIMLYKHNANIKRLLKGEEPKIQFKKKKADEA